MKVIIDSGISKSEMEEFFREKGREIGNASYEGRGWRVEMMQGKEFEYKSLPIPRTTVIFTGEVSAVDQLVSEYRKKFLKAGG